MGRLAGSVNPDDHPTSIRSYNFKSRVEDIRLSLTHLDTPVVIHTSATYN